MKCSFINVINTVYVFRLLIIVQNGIKNMFLVLGFILHDDKYVIIL